MTRTPYEDLVGSITTDITDGTNMNMLSDLAENYGIDTERYDTVGMNIYGTEDLFVSTKLNLLKRKNTLLKLGLRMRME